MIVAGAFSCCHLSGSKANSQVAQKTLIDDVAVLAVERCLIQRLPSLFSPDVVFELDDAQVHHVVAESEEIGAQRSCYADKLSILRASLLNLKRLAPYRSTITPGKSTCGGL